MAQTDILEKTEYVIYVPAKSNATPKTLSAARASES